MGWWSPRALGAAGVAVGRHIRGHRRVAGIANATLSMLAVLSRIRVAAIVARVVAAWAGVVNRLAGHRRIGVDEISYARDLIT
jgi:hypothetical protein